jgi:hypothetical protein
MTKITELTPHQESKLAEYRHKWIARGLSTDRINRDEAKENFIAFNSLVLGKKEMPIFIFMDSPISTWYAVCLLSQVRSQVWSQVWSQVGSQVESQVWSQVASQVGSQVRSQVWSQVASQVGSQVASQVESQVASQVWSQVRSQVWSQVGSQVGSQVESQVESQVVDFVYPYLYGNFDSGYYSFYDFINQELQIRYECQEKWDCYLNLSNVSLIYPITNFVIISEKPTEIKMKNLILHNDGGAAISYADGFSIYALNGVRVPQWLSEKKHNEIDPSKFATIENVEVRREFVRKVGIERIACHCGGKVIDSQGSYELIEIDLKGKTGKWPYLKMLNPSIGVWHLECVDKSCRTVQHALNFRNQSDLVPEQLT